MSKTKRSKTKDKAIRLHSRILGQSQPDTVLLVLCPELLLEVARRQSAVAKSRNVQVKVKAKVRRIGIEIPL